MDFIRAQFTKIPQITPVSLSNCTVLITGANSGIGFETAKEILKSRPKRLILGVRNLDRGNTAASELAKQATSTNIDVHQLDQSSFASVKAFADGLSGQRVDIAILNAGTWSFNWSQTTDGYETDLEVNVLGPALLSLLLLQNLRIAASARAGSSPDMIMPHLSFVSSGLHAMAKFPERTLPTGEVLAALNNRSTYNGADRYATTKLIGLLWAKGFAGLAAKDQVIVNAPNPGFCKTSLLNNASGVMKYMISAFSISMGRSAADGARCVVDAAMIKGDESHGRYLSEAQLKDEASMIQGTEGEHLQKKMWDEILGVLKREKMLPSDIL